MTMLIVCAFLKVVCTAGVPRWPPRADELSADELSADELSADELSADELSGAPEVYTERLTPSGCWSTSCVGL
jgi:hypothetical protein